MRAGFTLGLRREMRKFRELAEQRKKGGKFVGPPNFELGARAFGYGTLLCAAAGVLAWAAIQYTFGVTNVRAALRAAPWAGQAPVRGSLLAQQPPVAA